MTGMSLGKMYLGIDCGTQGTKALLVDETGRVEGRGYARHALIERESGAREQEPQWWVDALRSAVGESLGGAPDAGAAVCALGVSGQQHGLVVLDEALEVIRPAKLWNDTETAPQNAELVARLGGKEAWFQRFGIVPLTGYTVSKLLWIRENEPEAFGRIRHILLPHEYLNWWLTGELRAEPGDASGTGFFDNRTRQWTREVLDAIDGGTGQLFHALPPLMPSTGIVGTVRPEVARELGLRSDCVVAAGGGDNMMGAIGTGNVREGIVTLSLGTSSTVYSFSEHPVLDPQGSVAPFCSSSGGWLPLVCTMNATNVVTGTCEFVGETVAAIEPAGPRSDRQLRAFLNGERTPDLPGATGTLAGMNALNFTKHHLIRAAVEGVSFGILSGLDLVLAGKRAETLQVIGGGARSRAWRQLLADATGAQVVLPAEQEAGCLGAAIQARVAHEGTEGRTLSFPDAVAAFTQPGSEEVLLPDATKRHAYDRARRLYAERLTAIYGVMPPSQI